MLGLPIRDPQLIPQHLTRPGAHVGPLQPSGQVAFQGGHLGFHAPQGFRHPPQSLPGGPVSHHSAQARYRRGGDVLGPPADILRSFVGNAVVLFHNVHLRKGV